MNQGARTGASLVEVIIAVTLFGFLGAGVVTMVSATYVNQTLSDALVVARAYAQEGIAAVESLRAQGFNHLNLNTSGVHVAGGRWQWRGEGTSDTSGPYTRQVELSEVWRDATGSVVAQSTPGANIDTASTQVTVRVNWSIGLIPYELSLVRQLTDWQAKTWTQTDWTGGPGQETWIAPDGYRLDDGGVDTQTAGEVKLRAITAGPLDYAWPFTVPGEYAYTPSKIEISGGLARLLGSGTPVAGSTSNPGFSTSLAGWTFAVWGPSIGQVSNWSSSGGSPGGRAQIRMPLRRNVLAGAYFQQPFTVSATTLTSAALSSSWRVERSTRVPDSLRVLLFVDSAPGAPTLGTEVWTSANIPGTTAWAGTGSIDVSSQISGPGTYYLKLATWVDYPGQNGQYWVNFDNAQVTYSGTSTTYPSDSPSVTAAVSFEPATISTWQSFSSVEDLNGGLVTYQLSANGGVSWQWFNGSAWVATAGIEANLASVVNTNIGSFATTSGNLRFRAFLTGDGTQVVGVDEVRVTIDPGSAGYATSGSLESSAFGVVGVEPSWHRIVWDVDTVACLGTCVARFQVSGAPDASGVPGTFGPWTGASGPGSYFTESALIPTALNGSRWLKYRLEFSGDGTATPVVREVSVDYRP